MSRKAAGGFSANYLIDFASTLGAGATEPLQTTCFEYSVDFGRMLGRTLTLGFREDPWRRVERPEGLGEIGYFEAEEFDPARFRPNKPNASFANLTLRDGYWAAKIISAFTDRHLEGDRPRGDGTRVPTPRGTSCARWRRGRDAIARYFFDRVPPLDFFTVEDGRLQYHDLGVERGVYDTTGTRYRTRVAPVTSRYARGSWTPWVVSAARVITLDVGEADAAAGGTDTRDYPFFEIGVQVDRGDGWSRTTTVFVARASGRVVGIRR